MNNVYFCDRVRGLDISRAKQIAVSMTEIGLPDDWKIKVTIGKDAASKSIEELGLKFPVTLGDKKIDESTFQSSYEAFCDSLPGDCTIRMGSHSSLAYILASCVCDLPAPPIEEVSEEYALEWEWKSNSFNALSKSGKMQECRLYAIRLMQDGLIEIQADLKKYGYNRIQSIMGHKTAKLVVKDCLDQDLVMQVNNQQVLTDLAALPKVSNKDIKEVLGPKEPTKKAIGKKTKEKQLENEQDPFVKALLGSDTQGNEPLWQACLEVIRQAKLKVPVVSSK